MAPKGIFVYFKVYICTLQPLFKPSAKVQFLQFPFIQNSKCCARSIYRGIQTHPQLKYEFICLVVAFVHLVWVVHGWRCWPNRHLPPLHYNETRSYFAKILESLPAEFCDVINLMIFNRPRWESFHARLIVFLNVDQKKPCTHSKIWG